MRTSIINHFIIKKFNRSNIITKRQTLPKSSTKTNTKTMISAIQFKTIKQGKERLNVKT